MSEELHGGSIWIVEAGHPRKEAMLDRRMGYYAMGDATIPDVEELLKQDKYKRLVMVVAGNADFLQATDKKRIKRLTR